MASIDQDILVLDVEADRYHCLLNASALCHLDQYGRIEAPNQDTAEELIAAGWASREPLSVPRSHMIAASRELVLWSKPPLRHLAAAAIALATADRWLQRKSLGELIGCGANAFLASDPPNAHAVSMRVSAVRQVRPWLPLRGECLQRTFRLRSYLAAGGIATQWIFGVRTWPFSAHCWLQIDDMVVGDRLDRILRYTPIMRVG